MSKSSARAYTRACLKVLMASVMVATQCIAGAPGIKAQAQNPPIVDFPSLVGRSMGDVIQQFKSSRKVCREVTKDLLARVPPGMPSFDDHCWFKIGVGRLGVAAYRGRAVGFLFIFGLKAPTEPEEALRLVGINVNGTKPRETSYEYVWSGVFNEKNWKEVRVHQAFKNEKNRKCGAVWAILSYEAK